VPAGNHTWSAGSGLAAEATLKIAAAKALAQEFAVEIASGIFELAGTSATDTAVNLDRHWRNVRTHSLHDPARWKYVHLDNHTLHGAWPPRLGLVYRPSTKFDVARRHQGLTPTPSAKLTQCESGRC
jgi:hypothetical protein